MIITNVEVKIDDETYIPMVHFSGYYPTELIQDLVYTFVTSGNDDETSIKLAEQSFGELFVMALRQCAENIPELKNEIS